MQVKKITASVKIREAPIEYNIKEPIIRLFGRVTDSVDICVHIHHVANIVFCNCSTILIFLFALMALSRMRV